MKDFFLPAMLQNTDVAVFIAHVNLAVDDHGRAPDRGKQVVLPDLLAGLGVKAIENTVQVAHVEQAVENRNRGHGAAEVLVAAMPGGVGGRDVAAAGRVDAVEVADTGTVFGILADTDVDVVVIDHGSGDQVVARAVAAQFPFGILRIAVEFPDQCARIGIETVDPAVAPGENDLGFPAHHAVGR